MKFKEKKLNYYDEFCRNANIAVEISNIICDFIESYDVNDLPSIVEKVHKLENDADQNLHTILNFLAKDFLPPIEREDIVLLSNKIDDLIDYLDEIVINLDMLNIQILRDDFKLFLSLIQNLSTALASMFESFKDVRFYEKAHNFVIEINNMEEKGDKVFVQAVKNLYINEKNSIEVTKWNIIYNGLEECIDSYESIANTLDAVVLKNT